MLVFRGGINLFDINNPNLIFIVVLCCYFIPLIIGLILGKKEIIKVVDISKIGKHLSDPLTKKIHNWSRKYKLRSIKNNKWFLLFLLIFLNNLILTAFITKILYGIIFFVPLLLTVWEGLGHGVVFSKPKARGGIILTFFEFGGYLFATVIGVKFGINVFNSIFYGTQLIVDVPKNFIFLSIIFLTTGAIIESLSIRFMRKKVDLNNIDKMDFDKRRTEIAEFVDKKEDVE